MQEKGCSGFVGHVMDVHSIKKFLVKTVFESYCLKLSLPVFLKCFLILAQF